MGYELVVGAAQGSRQMIAALIRWSVVNRFLVLIATAFLVAAGVWSVAQHPASTRLPDLSDTQVIVRTPYPGKPPQVVEDLVTYPLTTTMLSVPGAKTVRGYSFFGDSFVYVLFDDKTDPYWARSRVVEYLNQVQSRLPPGATAALGPDATGVGWVYEYALVDRSGKNDLGQLRALERLVPEVRAEDRARRGRGRQHRRHGPAVPGRARPGPHARARHHAGHGDGGAAEGQPGRRAARSWSWPRPSTWCARAAS